MRICPAGTGFFTWPLRSRGRSVRVPAPVLERFEVGRVPALALRIGIGERAVLVHTRREARLAGPLGEVPDARDRRKQGGIAGLVPQRVLHLSDVAKLPGR